MSRIFPADQPRTIRAAASDIAKSCFFPLDIQNFLIATVHNAVFNSRWTVLKVTNPAQDDGDHLIAHQGLFSSSLVIRSNRLSRVTKA